MKQSSILTKRLAEAQCPPARKRLFEHRADLVAFTKEIRGYTHLTDAVDAMVDLTRWVDDALSADAPAAAQNNPVTNERRQS